MKELDLLLTRYLDAHYADAPPAEQQAFRELLETPDPVLLAYFTDRDNPADPLTADVIKVILARD